MEDSESEELDYDYWYRIQMSPEEARSRFWELYEEIKASDPGCLEALYVDVSFQPDVFATVQPMFQPNFFLNPNTTIFLVPSTQLYDPHTNTTYFQIPLMLGRLPQDPYNPEILVPMMNQPTNFIMIPPQPVVENQTMMMPLPQQQFVPYTQMQQPQCVVPPYYPVLPVVPQLPVINPLYQHMVGSIPYSVPYYPENFYSSTFNSCSAAAPVPGRSTSAQSTIVQHSRRNSRRCKRSRGYNRSANTAAALGYQNPGVPNICRPALLPNVHAMATARQIQPIFHPLSCLNAQSHAPTRYTGLLTIAEDLILPHQRRAERRRQRRQRQIEENAAAECSLASLQESTAIAAGTSVSQAEHSHDNITTERVPELEKGSLSEASHMLSEFQKDILTSEVPAVEDHDVEKEKVSKSAVPLGMPIVDSTELSETLRYVTIAVASLTREEIVCPDRVDRTSIPAGSSSSIDNLTDTQSSTSKFPIDDEYEAEKVMPTEIVTPDENTVKSASIPIPNRRHSQYDKSELNIYSAELRSPRFLSNPETSKTLILAQLWHFKLNSRARNKKSLSESIAELRIQANRE